MYELFRDLTDGVCIFDEKGCLKYINASAGSILGLDITDDLIGRRIAELVPIIETNDSFLQVFVDFLTDKTCAENLIDIENDDGSIRHVRVSVTHFEADRQTGERAILMLLTDYTELLKVRSVLERYTSKEIAKAALEEQDGDSRVGKLVDATVLFCDIRGYTALSSEMPASKLVEVVNHHFSVMDAVIRKYKGTVMEFLGDGILASFGVLQKNDDHAYSAVACAIEMQNAMPGINSWNEQQGITPYEIGIGINSGLMIAGNIGSKNTMKYQCIGQQVNLAGRIESYSVGGQVLISQSTYNSISAPVKYISCRKVLPKGTTTEIQMYDVCAVGGKYSVSLHSEQTEMTPLSNPVPITFCKLDGKAVSSERQSAQIFKISPKGALIRTDASLEVSDNIMINYGGEILAKVTDITDEGIQLRFTSKTMK